MPLNLYEILDSQFDSKFDMGITPGFLMVFSSIFVQLIGSIWS